MLYFLEILTVMLVALAAAAALAHAMELPGKMRLDKETYFAVQRIYYPGFTFGAGIGEAGGIVATAVLLFFVPAGTVAFWLVPFALLSMLATHAIYWVFIHPVNKYWVEGQAMGTFGTGFFASGTKREGRTPNWTELRDRWEYAHAARAVLTSASLLALVVSLIVQP
jgi:hypothetical protein